MSLMYYFGLASLFSAWPIWRFPIKRVPLESPCWMESSSIKLHWKVRIEWIVFEQKTIHSVQTFQRNPFDGDWPYPFNDLFIRVCKIRNCSFPFWQWQEILCYELSMLGLFVSNYFMCTLQILIHPGYARNVIWL